MKILGIDPGLLHLGYALIEVGRPKPSLLSYGTLSPHRSLDLPQALAFLHDRLWGIFTTYQPDYLACEEYLPMVNPTSSAKVAQAQALALLLAGKFSVPCRLYHPSTWKSMFFSGNGLGSPKDFRKILASILMENIPTNMDEHALDGLGLAVCLAFELKVL